MSVHTKNISHSWVVVFLHLYCKQHHRSLENKCQLFFFRFLLNYIPIVQIRWQEKTQTGLLDQSKCWFNLAMVSPDINNVIEFRVSHLDIKTLVDLSSINMSELLFLLIKPTKILANSMDRSNTLPNKLKCWATDLDF